MRLSRKSIFFISIPCLISGVLLSCGSPVNDLKNYQSNQAPVIISISSDSPGANELLPNMEIKIEAAVYDPDENPLSYEFSSGKVGSFTETKKTTTGCEVVYILPAFFSSKEDITVTLKVTDIKGLATIKTLDLGSGKTGPTLHEEGQAGSYITAEGSRTIKWQADDDGYYQVNVLDSEGECSADIGLPFIYYSENEWIETLFTGPLAKQSDGRQLDYGENRVCIIVVDALGQEGYIEKKIIVDANPPATKADLTYGDNSGSPGLILRCKDDSGSSESGCDKIIYTITTDGTPPPDPEFGNKQTGTIYDSFIKMEKNDHLYRIKYRAIDIAGNIEKVKWNETDFRGDIPDDITDYISPEIKWFRPSGGNVDYVDGVNIDIEFSENILESTLPATLNISEEGSATGIPNRFISYDPEGSVARYYIETRELIKYTQYNVLIPNTITDVFNNEITGTLEYWFRTQSFEDPRIVHNSIDQCGDTMNVRLFYSREMNATDMDDKSFIKVTHTYTEYGSGPNLYPSDLCASTVCNETKYNDCMFLCFATCMGDLCLGCPAKCNSDCIETEYHDPCYVWDDYKHNATFKLPFKYGISDNDTFVFEGTVNLSASSTNRERLYIEGPYYSNGTDLHPAVDLNDKSSSQFSLIYANDTNLYPEIPDFTSNTCP
jgi:hypothetical protein